MSEFRIDQITNQSGTAGPNIAGISTFNSTSGLLMPSGDTFRRNVLDDVVTDGLVLYLDAGNDISYPGSGTTWTDLSGNGNNGTLVGGLTYSTSNGGSVVFNGDNNRYILFNNVTTSSLGLKSSDGATLSCWLKLTLLSRWTGVFSFWGPNSGEVDFGWDINPSNLLRIWKNSSAIETISLTSYSNIWTHYTLVSNSSGTIFYINGNQFTTTSITGNIVGFNSNRFLMFGDTWDNAMLGNVSNINVHNRALSASEVLQNYNALKGRYGL